MTYASCPACSHSKAAEHGHVFGIKRCLKCDAIYGQCYLGDSYSLVLPYWHEGPSRPEEERYFDFETLGSKGVERRHGWFNTTTRRITQTG